MRRHMTARVVRFRSIRQRLLTGFWLLVGLFVAAGLVSRASMLTMSTLIGDTLSEVREDGQQASRLTASLSDRSWWVRYRAAQALCGLPTMDEPAR